MKLNVNQVAKLKGCTTRYIRMLIEDKVIKAELSPSNGNNAEEYIIDIDDLPADLRQRYDEQQLAGLRQKSARIKHIPTEEEGRQKNFDEFSSAERVVIATWEVICREWAMYDGTMPEFVAWAAEHYRDRLAQNHLSISTGIMYRKYKAYKIGNLDGLVDQRGKLMAGSSTVDDTLFAVYCRFALRDQKPALSKCYEHVIDMVNEFPEKFPELDPKTIPSERAFRRRFKAEIPENVKILARDGEKAYHDKCMPYVERIYDELHSNDIWIGDNYTLDVISQDANGTQHRLYLTAFRDALSGIFVGWNITEQPCGHSTILALKNGARKNGLPKKIYVDNGREFLFRSFGGKGHRSRKGTDYENGAKTILEHLKIEMINAIPRNAKAKPIEGAFHEIKDGIMRLFGTYTGGNVVEKPESLKYTLKKGNIPRDQEFKEAVGLLLESEYNEKAYGGKLTQYKGKTKREVFRENLTEIRKATERDLALMTMQSTLKQKIGRNGVHVIAAAGEKLNYNSVEMEMHFGESVYVRYDLDALQAVRIYEAETDKYICDAKLIMDNYLLYDVGDDRDQISLAESNIRAAKKRAKNRLNDTLNLVPDNMQITELELLIRKANNMDIQYLPSDVPILPVRAEEEEYEQAVGGGGVVIDINRMLKNAQRRDK